MGSSDQSRELRMNKAIWLAALFALLPSATSSQVNPNQLKWGPAPPGLPRGAQLAVLSGNPGAAGPFVIRLRFPAGYAVAPHHHPTDEYVTVISGQLSLGMGNRANRARAAALGSGGFVNAPAQMNHYAFTRSGATIQINGEGPFQIVYANPADDPRR
jgi:quercetin dioxygenase-like cupin family protein